ncbi:phosphate ABC transporter permease subunit PstC [Paenibacillus silvae]|uniref:phosphate ABC transporter permease subunit PstC n=1 Tax=Paenibacillus silvae TaxID=1325358 RepID=UPI0020030758|nr:phosphate ABC transporter permease subunit PstC [Paenibacillus silvae]MCK6075091.1 phosphate ABC transporter permease subunit PstC [Paenibacillus silvae]MCK6149478.1 phosphate ABC transporter permease subunit PstC [Paenibacillus silvae]MCK6267777.1 phosphate ABC transporter permease subunit PstC [Paenibacillus silvae]
MMEMNPPAKSPAPNELGSSLGRAPGKGRRFDRKARLRWSNRMFRILCIASAAFVCLVLFCILVLMLRTGVLTFADVSLKKFFFSTNWDPENEHYGALTFILGTFALTGLTMLMAIPLSVIIAVFLAEMTPKWLRTLLRPVLDLLVGIPSVVYGFLGLTVLIPWLRDLSGRDLADGLLAASIVLTIMVLPTISRISDDAISAVPNKYRDAAYALGTNRFQTIIRVVLPAARGGIMYAVILGMTRAIGETMAVVMVIGNTAQLPTSLFTPTAVLTSNIVMQISSVEFDSTWNHGLYMMGFILLAISILMIVAVRMLQKRGGRHL